jgi:hypothetical protein
MVAFDRLPDEHSTSVTHEPDYTKCVIIVKMYSQSLRHSILAMKRLTQDQPRRCLFSILHYDFRGSWNLTSPRGRRVSRRNAFIENVVFCVVLFEEERTKFGDETSVLYSVKKSWLSASESST